jgi:hypothetical protein
MPLTHTILLIPLHYTVADSVVRACLLVVLRPQGAYFLGKVLWAKGYTELLERLQEHTSATGQNVEVDVYGSGPDLSAVQEAARSSNLRLTFNGPKDHADASLQVGGACRSGNAVGVQQWRCSSGGTARARQ